MSNDFYCRIGQHGLLYDTERDMWAIAKFLVLKYTLCLKKVYPLMFDNNFGKYWPIKKILSPIDS